VLKPGQCFATYEWCMTDHYDGTNPVHQKIKAEVELGNGLPDIRSTKQCLQAAIDAGFEVHLLSTSAVLYTICSFFVLAFYGILGDYFVKASLSFFHVIDITVCLWALVETILIQFS
jgi:hypothetical protein